MKIIMIGPIYPFKGGIAQYTGAMCTALAAKHEVKAVSFSMLYPKALYKHEQRDPENITFRYDPVTYPLSSIDPITWGKTARQILEEKPDLVILQWWHPWFAPCYHALLRRIGKKTKVLALCHNVLPHEGFPMKETLSRAVLRKCSAYIVHSKKDEEDLRKLVRDPLCIRTVHPTYNHFKKRNLSREEARKELGIPENEEMLLFFGYIREYKGLKHLIRALGEIWKARPKTRLYVVGDFFENNKEEYLQLIRDCGADDGITLVDGYLPDDQVEPYFAAADICVLPYESATQSGVVQIAYSFELPVIVTRVGGLPEVVQDGKTGYVIPPKDENALAAAVIRFFSEDKADIFREGIREEQTKYSWERMTENVEKLYCCLEEAKA